MEKMTNKKALMFVLNGGFTLPTDVTDRLRAMVMSLDKKAENKKPTTIQKENIGYKDEILATLEVLGKPATITDIQNASDALKALSNQRVTALVKLLKDEGKVTKEVVKKKSYFTLAETQSEDDKTEDVE